MEVSAKARMPAGPGGVLGLAGGVAELGCGGDFGSVLHLHGSAV